MNIKDLRKRISNKNFFMTYEEAVNFESPEEINYTWYEVVGGNNELLYVLVPLFGDVKFSIKELLK